MKICKMCKYFCELREMYLTDDNDDGESIEFVCIASVVLHSENLVYVTELHDTCKFWSNKKG